MDEGQEKTEVINTVTIEEAGPCKKKVIIEIPEEKIRAATDEQYDSLRKDAVVPGFRKGRAPRRLLEKRFGKEAVEQVKLKLLADAMDSAIKDNKVDTLRDPDFDHEKIELPEKGPLKFDFEVEVRPEFELPKLEGIAIKKTKLAVTDKQIDAEIEHLQKYSGMWAPKEEGSNIEAGDQIIADAILKIEDVEEEEKLDNIEIFVRSHGFVGGIPIEKLDELLVGAKVGEDKETGVEVPKTYYKEEYRGKKVNVRISVKEIKWLKPAELNEDFFTKFGAENEKELRGNIRKMLEGRLEQQLNREIAEQIHKYMLDNTDFELPTSVVAEQAGSLLQRQYANLISRGLSREQLEEQMETLRAGSEEQAQEQLKTFFIMDKVAEKLEIEVSDEEINGQISALAIQQGTRPERMREEMSRDSSLVQFKLQIREEKCIAKLLESAVITEVAAKKEVKKVKKAVKKTTKKTAKKTKSSEKKEPKKDKTAAKKKTDK